MKFKIKVVPVLLLFITSFLLFSYFVNDVKGTHETDMINYDFKKNTLFDSLDKDLVNLRHNNIITKDYNGTYSFINDTIESKPIGWNNLSSNNAKAFIQDNFKEHDKIINISNRDVGDGYLEQIFDDGSQVSGIIEFWILSTNISYNSYVILVDNALQCILFLISENNFRINDGGWQNLDIIPTNNDWYHIYIDFDCITDTTDIYINDYYEGNYGFGNIGNSIDRIWLMNDNAIVYSTCYDAIGYDWSSNYTLTENIYPNIEITNSDILSNDKYEFNLDATHTPYNTSLDDPTIYDWYDQGQNKMDIAIPNITTKNINGIYQIGVDGGTFIRNDWLEINNDKINLTFGLQILEMKESYSEYYILVRSLDDSQLIQLKLDPIIATNSLEIEYDPTGMAPHVVLGTITHINPNDVYNFNLYIDNFNVRLIWYKNDVYNDTYVFPLINDKKGIKEIQIVSYDAQDSDNEYFITRLNYVGIYQYNVSISNEKGFISYYFNRDWKFNKYNLFTFNSSYDIRIIGHGLSTNFFHIFRGFDNQDFFINLHDDLVLDDGLTIIDSSLYLIIYHNIILSEYLFFSIEGIKLDKYVNNVFDHEKFIKFYYHNVDKDNSYYYIDDANRLHYQLDITQNDTHEYIMLYFDFIRHVISNNKSIYFKCREISAKIGIVYIDIAYWQPPNFHYEFKTYLTTVNIVLEKGHELFRFYYVAYDQNNNNNTNQISEGFLYRLGINYKPYSIALPIIIIPLGFIQIMIPIIILIVPTIGIYGVVRKRGVIIPSLILMTIICFSSALIPFELFLIMMMCFGCGIFLEQKYKKEYD